MTDDTLVHLLHILWLQHPVCERENRICEQYLRAVKHGETGEPRKKPFFVIFKVYLK